MFCDAEWFEPSHLQKLGQGEKVIFSSTDLVLTALEVGV